MRITKRYMTCAAILTIEKLLCTYQTSISTTSLLQKELVSRYRW